MTNEQINILIRDGDIILSGWEMSTNYQSNQEVEMMMFASCPHFYNDGKLYDLSNTLIESLSYIFKLYSTFESLRIAIFWRQKIERLMQETLNEQKIILLKNNVQKQIEKRQDYQEELPEWIVECVDPGWMYIQRNNLERIIEALKFKVFGGKQIEVTTPKNDIDNYLNCFFGKNSELNCFYQWMATKKKLEWLQAKINDLESPDKKLIQNNISDNVKKFENKFCKSMELVVPKEHFKIFTEKSSKNGSPFLTNEQMEAFIQRAFLGRTELPKQKFNQIPKGEKSMIQGVFYDFYDKYCFESFNTMQCQGKFIELLTDNFEGWNFKNVKANFKPKTKKRL